MNVYEQIEILSLDLFKDNSINWNLIDDFDITPKQLISLIDKFLLNLKEDHNLPGSDYVKLQSIAHWIKENNDFTEKQKQYVLISICHYWNQQNLIMI